ncbi:MAG: pilus assembly protein [Firmicutes bacterium]|nr:pilus assembly protein [Dethiobacter sp.]MBS3889188.1 pilus assembly protein [Bacillota bacterium]MBS4055664.1 pilus assembly protein [Thermaerobacter sp.]
MKKSSDRQSGQALVELALVLPILLLILMAIVDFGRVFHGHLAVTAAARQAGREASLGRTDAEITSRAISAAAPLAASRLVVQVSPAFSLRHSGTVIEIVITYPMEILMPLIEPFLPSPHLIVGRAVVRRE